MHHVSGRETYTGALFAAWYRRWQNTSAPPIGYLIRMVREFYLEIHRSSIDLRQDTAGWDIREVNK